MILSQQVAQQSWRHGVRGVRRCSVLQQRTNAKHSQVRPKDAHQERWGHYYKRQLPWHLALPLGREIGHRPRCGWERPLGDLCHRSQQRTTGGQPGGESSAARKIMRCGIWTQEQITPKSHLTSQAKGRMSHENELLLRSHKWDTEPRKKSSIKIILKG